MGILDWFKFTPPEYKKFGLFVLNYLTNDEQARAAYLQIQSSPTIKDLKLDLDLFSKHFKAILMKLLSSRIPHNCNPEMTEKFTIELIQSVKKHDQDIWKLVTHKYDNAYELGGLEGMLTDFNKKPFKNKLDSEDISVLLYQFQIVEEQFDMVIKNFK
tara:strand:+ start:82 stop:555 length:474 start_codon:yes stop_codon:yes gene_type:complete